MFRYVLAILLITCYHSLGLPVVNNLEISSSIRALANNCPNSVLRKLFKDKLEECNITASQYQEKQLQCLMVYDMGVQLCTAISQSQIILNKDFLTQINEEVNMVSLCETAKDWVFTDLPNYKKYKKITETELKLSATCGKICGKDDLINANFYCKFYKWGLEVMNTSISITSTTNTKVANAQSKPDTSSIVPDRHIDSTKNANEPLDFSIKPTTTNDKSKETDKSSVPSEKVIFSNNATVVSQQIHKIIGKPDETQSVGKKSESSIIAPGYVTSTGDKVGKEEQNKDVNSTVPLGDSGRINPTIEPVLDRKDKFDLHQDQYLAEESNSEDGKDGNDDTQDDEDVGADMTGEALQKNTQIENKFKPKDARHNKEYIPQKEPVSENAQDLSTDDDDDHFFTFFLTAVVLVVLLYILYHDKSKISKLFFGLLVEGRSGRRRNGRGHAYRRLDTLEQAMSTNTAAPPSKIIY